MRRVYGIFLVAFREASWNFPRQDHGFKELRALRGFPGMELGILGWPNPQVRADDMRDRPFQRAPPQFNFLVVGLAVGATHDFLFSSLRIIMY